MKTSQTHSVDAHIHSITAPLIKRHSTYVLNVHVNGNYNACWKCCSCGAPVGQSSRTGAGMLLAFSNQHAAHE
jgi:hypothetical protein